MEDRLGLFGIRGPDGLRPGEPKLPEDGRRACARDGLGDIEGDIVD